MGGGGKNGSHHCCARIGPLRDGAAPAPVGATVVDAPMGELAIRWPAAVAMAAASGDRLLTPAGGGGSGGQWRLAAGAEWWGMKVCAAGRSAFGAVAVAGAIPQPEVPLGLTVVVGDEAGVLMLPWPAGADWQWRRDAGIKPTDDQDAGSKLTDDRDAGKCVSFIRSALARHTQHDLIRYALTPQIRSDWDGGAAYGFAADAGREVFGNGE